MALGRKSAAAIGTAAVIATTTAFLPNWEGTDLVAKKDPIGTGHPVTYCHGQTDEFGKVKEGTRFTKEQCAKLLGDSLPKYLIPLDKCIKVPLPVHAVSSLLDAAYNAGPAAVCRSPMLAKMNDGDLRGGCDALRGWYIRSDGQARKGLVARRSGIGDGRKSERDLCLEGLSEPKTAWYVGYDATIVVPEKVEPKPAPPSRWAHLKKWVFK